MAKGYWIARIDVHNPDGYKDYVAQNGPCSRNTAASFWYVPAGMFPRKAPREPATW